MNKRQVITLWVIAILLGAAVAIVKINEKDSAKSSTNRSAGSLLFESFPGSDVANLEIQGADGSVTLVKKDGKWTVAQRDSYPANTTNIHEFIRTLTDLKVTRTIEAGPSFAPRFGMDEAATKPAERGLTATFKDASGKEIAKVSIGKNIESKPDAGPMESGSVGRYIRNHADSSGFYASSEMFPTLTTEVPRWLDDTFVSPEKIKSITVSQADKAEPSWTVTRDTEEAEFKLADAVGDEVLDNAVGGPLKNLFSYARFDDVLSTDKATEQASPNGKRTITIDTFEGFHYTVTLTPEKSSTPPPATPNPQAAPPADKVHMTVTVNAELPKERKKEDGEKPEDAKTKDNAFSERLKSLTEKLAKEKSLSGRTFVVAKSTVESLLKDRSQVITKANQAPAPGAEGSGPGVQQHPGGLIVPQPPTRDAVKKPIEAVTPPIEVPPADTDKSQSGGKK